MKQKKMKKKSNKDESGKRQRLAIVAGVILFIGVFSFVFWFIVFPLVWSALPAQGWPPFWFNIYSGISFLVWALVILLALLLLWHHRDKIVPVKPDPTPAVTSGREAEGPEYPTKLALIQPDNLSDKARQVFVGPRGSPTIEDSVSLGSIFKQLEDDVSSQDDSSTQSLQTVVPNTQNKESDPVDIVRKVIPAKNNGKKISCTESESSLETAPVVPPTSTDIKTNPDKSGVMLRKKPDLKLVIGKDERDSGPAPQSPRELFFKDLLLKAEESRARARSQEVRLVPMQKIDDRKSMPAGTWGGKPPSPVDSPAKVVSQSPKSVQPVMTHQRNSSEEYFIAQVSPTQKNVSEVRLFVSDGSNSNAPAIQWKLVSDGDRSSGSRLPSAGRVDSFIDSERRHAQSSSESDARTFDDSVF